MRYRRASVAVALFGLIPTMVSSSARADQVDDYVRAEMQRQKIPGLSIAVVRNGEVVKAQGYGLANVELNVAATPDTIYQSGSIGKQFTATLVMMLVEEGKMSLGDPISKYIPDAPAIGPVEHKAIQMDTKVFDAYAGEYVIVPGFVIAISREGDGFRAKFPGQSPMEIFAESDTMFFVKGDELQLTFVKDAGGAVTHLIVDQVGSRLEAKKIK